MTLINSHYVHVEDIPRIPRCHKNLAGVPRRIFPSLPPPTFARACAYAEKYGWQSSNCGGANYSIRQKKLPYRKCHINGSVVQKQRSREGVKRSTPRFQRVNGLVQFQCTQRCAVIKAGVKWECPKFDRLVHGLAACSSEVNENSSLCIVAVDHRQHQRWIEKLALALVRSQAC